MSAPSVPPPPMRIVAHPDPVLRQPCDAIEDELPGLPDLADEMLDLMKRSNGIGLAAPQVGISLRLFVVDIWWPDEKTTALYSTQTRYHALTFVNPKIVKVKGPSASACEGCLSFPGMSRIVVRPAQILVRARDVRGNRFELEAGGLLARVIQHEYDHLEGRLLIDHIEPPPSKVLIQPS